MTNNEKIIELMNIFEKAKEKFLKDEKEIIRIDINERTLSARLMFHLQILKKQISPILLTVNITE